MFQFILGVPLIITITNNSEAIPMNVSLNDKQPVEIIVGYSVNNVEFTSE